MCRWWEGPISFIHGGEVRVRDDRGLADLLDEFTDDNGEDIVDAREMRARGREREDT